MLRILWGKITNLFKKKPDPFEKGRFQWDWDKEEWVKVSSKQQSEGKYAMPLQDYIERSRHLSKGSWRRPTDVRHIRQDALKDDYGTAGCRNGRGLSHPMRNGRCIYCGLDKGQLEKMQKAIGV